MYLWTDRQTDGQIATMLNALYRMSGEQWTETDKRTAVKSYRRQKCRR